MTATQAITISQSLESRAQIDRACSCATTCTSLAAMSGRARSSVGTEAQDLAGAVEKGKWKLRRLQTKKKQTGIRLSEMVNASAVQGTAGHCLSVHSEGSSSDINKRISIFKRMCEGFKFFRALRAPALS